ncbi:uncharacterized protein LOC117194626 [Drosophila miranda]|uniref:uncharacterized protein LOC117194626 n=1 Tax=Drosophila miranda TaxID=7229 RepID=UPI00143F24BF|nr:uncharacterized protein LOC117194626 [Drosophila miranda]
MPFLGQIHTSPLLSRPMGPIGHAHPPPFPPMGDSDGFNAVPQMASMGPPPVLSSLWTGGASPDSRGDYYDDPHEEYSDCRYEGDYGGDYSMPTEEDQEEESCSCQSQSEFSLIERTKSDSEWEELSDGPSPGSPRWSPSAQSCSPQCSRSTVSAWWPCTTSSWRPLWSRSCCWCCNCCAARCSGWSRRPWASTKPCLHFHLGIYFR